jgi:hypothetical protein
LKLPSISYGSVPDTVAPAAAQAGASVQRLGGVVEQGLTAFGQELVKTQTQQASVDLSKRLSAVEQGIRSSPYVPVSKLKEQFGEDLSGLPEDVRGHVQQIADSAPKPPPQDYDPTQGPTRPPPDSDPLIPTWAVAGSIYEKQAKEALGKATVHITTGAGWQGAFRHNAMAHVVERQGRLNLEQSQALLSYLGDTHKRQATEAAAAGDFGLAHSIINGSEALPPQEKGALRHQVGVLADTKGAYDAMRMVAVPATTARGLELVDEELARVNDPKSFVSLTPREREVLAHELSASSKAYHAVSKQREAAALAFGYASDSRDDKNPMRVSPEKAFDALDQDFQAGRFKGREEMWPEIRRVLQEHISGRNEASRLTLGNTQGDAFQQFMGLGPDGQPHMSFSNVQPQTLQELHRYGKDGEETIKQLIEWEKGNQARERNLRQLPSPDESAKAFVIEREIAIHPGKYRAMDTGKLLGLLSGTYQDPDGAIPGGAVSAKDLPHLSELFAKNSAAVKAEHVTDAGKIAFEEAEVAFPSLKKYGEKATKAPEDLRKAYQLLKDKLDAFRTAHRDASGNDPPDADVRKEAQRLLSRDIELRDSFLFIPYTRKTSPIELEVETGKPSIEAETPPASAAPPRAPAAPAKPSRKPPVEGAVHVTDGKQGAWLKPGAKMPQGWKAD